VVPVSAAAQASADRRASTPERACDDALAIQVLLDQNGFSPGEIDGQLGANGARALSAFQAARELPASGAPDCATFEALGGTTTEVTQEYVLTEADTNASFVADLPDDLVAQAELPALGYRTLLERIGERFHASPALLERLNPGVRFAAGSTIVVPAVPPFDPDAKPSPDRTPKGVRLEVRREDSSLRVLGADGALLFFAPVTLGSEHDPLPIGNWTAKGVAWMPTFNYNPELFWDADPKHAKATLKPGPNNPVGVVWIDIDVEHYGIHGTPEPSRVGHAASHGCVRLTNWDAIRVASFVTPGTPVVFK